MSNVMQSLRSDHRNVALMLDLLERQLDCVAGPERSVDFELMHDVMIYMTHYPDNVHHPMEDLMFERMRERAGADAAPILDELVREHAALAEKGVRFRDSLGLVVDGALVERAELEAAGRDYTEFLRFHMRKEDEGVFPLAERSLDPEDWERVAERFEASRDPVFGPVVAGEYRALLEAIRKAAE